MPITDLFERLELDRITVLRDERQRREIDTSDLEESIRARGVLVPLIVSASEAGACVLVAGERRLETCRKLGLPDVPVRWLHDLDPIEAQIIELEENIKRRDLPWQDQIRATAKIHELYRQRDADWTMVETAEAIGLTRGHVSLSLRVESELGQERIAEASTMREAYNILQRKEARAEGNALEELVNVPPLTVTLQPQFGEAVPSAGGATIIQIKPTAPPPDPDPVIVRSFLDWAPSYAGEKFNLIHCDFPYGRNEFSGPQMRGSETTVYASDARTYFDLLECLCTNLDRFCSLSAHLMFWCAGEIMNPTSDYARMTWQVFAKRAPSLVFRPFPLIWVKSDNSGIAADPRHGPRHVYEVCLLASRSARQISKIVSDAYVAPGDRRLHPSTKPEPMLRHFMTMLVDDTSRVLDPTAGSGAALRAATGLGAGAILGLEIDPEYARSANQAWRQAKLLRVASRGAGAV